MLDYHFFNVYLTTPGVCCDDDNDDVCLLSKDVLPYKHGFLCH